MRSKNFIVRMSDAELAQVHADAAAAGDTAARWARRAFDFARSSLLPGLSKGVSAKKTARKSRATNGKKAK